MAEVSRRRVLGTPRLRWMDGGSKGMTVEAERQCAKDRTKRRSLVLKQKIEFDAAVLLAPVFFWTVLSRSGDLSPERDGIPLHDAVGVNCRKGATSEKQGT